MSRRRFPAATITSFEGFKEIHIPQKPSPPLVVREGLDGTLFIGTRGGTRWSRSQIEVLVQVLGGFLRTGRLELDLPVDERDCD